MSAIDTAFELLKNYTPNWRDEVRNIAPLDEEEVPFIDQWDTEDDEAKEEMEGFIASGTKAHVFEHPWSVDHVIKIPVDDPYSVEEFEDRIDPDMSEGLRFLEELGYPLVGEVPMGQDKWSHTIQPKMRQVFGRPRQDDRTAADRALAHLLADRHNGNWAVDSANKPRMIDNERVGISDDYWPGQGANQAEVFQSEFLDPVGIQHPTSKILDFFDGRERGRFGGWLRTMEELESVSDNPNTLTLDGKPYWLEGYE
jgi:hypothetical protein